MSDIIRLLPDSVANQIAAGEVIQRPASVVKELIENAIDAGADNISIHVKDAGRTLIQVIDNGKGMSPTDARLSFERHATSKIRQADDLFSIRTMGFRGEALASIASVADVELRTRQHGDELGTYLHILGSVFQKQQSDNCPEGSNFSVKNLFFNVPARRKFLKSNSNELRNIITEIQRVALSHPNLNFSFYHNQIPVYELPHENLRKRIITLFGKTMNQSLTPVETDTSIVRITGFIGQPAYAKKSFGEQFFFVNGRFMKHPFFHRAVMYAYEKILPADAIPSYFLYFEVDPSTIDINIHPTKTEIKFEDEQAIWQIINASVREAIGKYNLMPAIDFDQGGSIDIPLAPTAGSRIAPPQIEIDRSYNPFQQGSNPDFRFDRQPSGDLRHWEKLYTGLEGVPAGGRVRGTDSGYVLPDQFSGAQTGGGLYADTEELPAASAGFLQLKNRFLLTPVKSGLMLIDQREAHARILYDQLMLNFSSHLYASQRLLFPATIELNAADAEILKALLDELGQLGFDIRTGADGTFQVEGTPAALSHLDASELVESVIASFQDRPTDLVEEVKSQVAAVLAQSSALNFGIPLKPEEMSALFNQLFACRTPVYSPSGKRIVSIIPVQDIEKLLRD